MGTVVPVMEKSLADSLQTIGTSHRARSGALATSLDDARIRCIGAPDAVMLETWESWLLTMQVHSAVFAAAFTDQETSRPRGRALTPEFGHRGHQIPGICRRRSGSGRGDAAELDPGD
ncbi:hypothetical protein ACIA74_41910 [Streptomyces sp. NPDC051658]|uniref:hypothetical protein n=1 Tax=Streptomyces sp. NPDC051658 TaxID=3365667 RepID=UPI003792930F